MTQTVISNQSRAVGRKPTVTVGVSHCYRHYALYVSYAG